MLSFERRSCRLTLSALAFAVQPVANQQLVFSVSTGWHRLRGLSLAAVAGHCISEDQPAELT